MTDTIHNKEVILVADPMCSWCWGFAPAIRAIRQQYADRLNIVLVVGGLRAAGRAGDVPGFLNDGCR